MTTPAFRPLPGIYEPSAIQQMADGRFLVVEDEKAFPFSAFTLAGERVVAATLAIDAACEDAQKLDDLEALSADAAGFVYAITSHSRDGDGDEKKSREKLARFRVEGGRIVDARVCRGLKAALVATHPLLAAAAAVRDVKTGGGLNVEALEMAPDGRLLVGFRSPLDAGRALLASIDNPAEVFAADASPRIGAALTRLDLGGDGLRGLAWVPSLGGYLAIGGPQTRERSQFRLWFWSGGGAAPRPVSVPGLPGFAHAEGVAAASVDGRPAIVVVSDDGSRAEGRPANYLVLDPASLRIGG